MSLPICRWTLTFQEWTRVVSRSEGNEMNGPLREVYHRYGADQIGYRLPASVLTNDSAEYVTELQAPLEGV